MTLGFIPLGGPELLIIIIVMSIPAVVCGLIGKYRKNRNFVSWFFIGFGITFVWALFLTAIKLLTKVYNPLVFGLLVWAAAPLLATFIRKH